jgi:hypothetical protein
MFCPLVAAFLQQLAMSHVLIFLHLRSSIGICRELLLVHQEDITATTLTTDHQLCLQREQEIQRQAMMPGATGLICSSAFFEDRRREYVQKQEWLCRNMPFCGLR